MQDKKPENPYYNKAFELLDAKETDSAFGYFDKAKNHFIQNNDSLRASACLINMAIISTDFGDHFGGQEIALEALGLLDTTNQHHFPYLHSTYNTLGITAFSLKNYTNAIRFYSSSLKYATDSSYKLITQNNIANAYRNLKNYPKALKIYHNILAQPNMPQKEYARTLSNMAYTQWLNNPNHLVRNDFLKALHIRKTAQDRWGQNASYAHLADYYERTLPDSALHYAQQMYHTASTLHSPDDQLEALQKLIRLEKPQNSKLYFSLYQRLSDSLQTSRNAAKNQFALIRYETEKHKTELLQAQADNASKENSILRLNIALIVSAMLLIGGYIWYKKRKRHLQQEKELEVKNTELKYAKKVHDRVANKVYHVMSEVENTAQLDKDVLLDKLDNIYHITRNISYEIKDINPQQDFPLQLANMIKSYASAGTQIFIIGNEENVWKPIKPSTRSELFYVVQELMTNMKKHSQASSVVVKFEQLPKGLQIGYSDDGIGFEDNYFKNGLQNTGNRINHIGGAITFDTKPGEGVHIKVWCPYP